MGDNVPHRRPGRGRTWSGSSTGPEAAAHQPDGRQAARLVRPGEDRYLTRARPQYAAGCWWGRFFTPAGCLTASAGRGAEPRGFRGPVDPCNT